MLARLAAHYYRPDFTEGQARSLIGDYCHDLQEFEVADVLEAVRLYRRDPASKFFPPVGTLRKLAVLSAKDRRERFEAEQRGPLKPECGDSRPNMWWCQRRALWKPHWRESEIPTWWTEGKRHAE